MKNCFLVLMFASSATLTGGYCIVKKNKSEYAGILSNLLLIASFTIFLYVLAHVSKDSGTASMLFGAHFAATEWLLLWMYKYIITYTHSEPVLKEKKVLLILCAALNIAFLFVNNYTGFMFRVSLDTFRDEVDIWTLEYQPFFYIHIIYCYYLTACILIRLIRKTIQSADVYQRMYFPLFVQILIVSGISVAYFYLQLKFDISLLLYSITMLIMCYYALYATPKNLIETTLVKIAEDMQHSIFCFDLRGKCIYINNYSMEMFQVSKDELIEEAEHQFTRWRAKRNGMLSDYEKGTIPVSYKGVQRQIEFEFQKIKDKKNEIAGFFVKMEDHTDEIERLQKEQYLAMHDNLTGLYKREFFLSEASKIMKNNPDKKWYIICSDIRNFKLINDFFGEETGDKLLKNQATYIKTLCNDYCIAGRIISDRFAILMSEQQFDAQILEREVGQMQYIDETIHYQVRVVFGVYEVEDIHENVRIMCDKAYMAFATIEDDYQKHVVYYDNTMLDHMLYEKQILEDLKVSIEDNRFCLYFQPKADRNGNIIGAEALVRWNHPTLGFIFPDEFVKIYEKTGLIYKLDYYIWEETAKKLSEWKKQGITDISISVNISAKDFYYADLAAVFIQLVSKYELKPENLHLEITESVVFSDDCEHVEMLRKLQEYGFIIEIDDFGSGYASLQRVQNLCADMLKIDMMFLSKTTYPEKSDKILNSVIQMAKKLGMQVITEGVEDEHQFRNLVGMGGDYFQGYYFSPPIAVEEFERRYLQLA